MLIIPIFINHQGCPHTCLFCNQQHIAGEDKGIADDRHQVVQTIESWLASSRPYKEVQVAFYGGSFTCLPEEQQQALLEVVQPYLEQGRISGLRLSTRPDCIDGDMCDFLKSYGVTTVELGVQSLTDQVLRLARRGHDSGACGTAVVALQGAGMSVGMQLMPGLPGETTASFLHTVAKTIDLAPAFVRLYPCLVITGTGLAELYCQQQYRPLSLLQAVALCATAYKRLTHAGIRVVRMGLQPTAQLEASLVAGPFHPAFGELVVSRLWLKRLRARLALLAADQCLEVTIAPRDYSAVVGSRKQNLIRLHSMGYADRFRLRTDAGLPRGSCRYAVC